MKYILFFLIVTQNGVTESQSDFVTWEACNQAADEIHLKYDKIAMLISTECKVITLWD
jgi:hypothetical protein